MNNLLKHKPHMKLKGVLIERGLTQNDIAKIIGVAAGTVNKKINGSLSFTFDEVMNICNSLNISSDAFCTLKQ